MHVLLISNSLQFSLSVQPLSLSTTHLLIYKQNNKCCCIKQEEEQQEPTIDSNDILQGDYELTHMDSNISMSSLELPDSVDRGMVV